MMVIAEVLGSLTSPFQTGKHKKHIRNWQCIQWRMFIGLFFAVAQQYADEYWRLQFESVKEMFLPESKFLEDDLFF